MEKWPSEPGRSPSFKVLGKRGKRRKGAIGKVHSFTDAEKDDWANLFDYMGSEENVRLKFALDKIGVGLNETSIIFGDSLNGDAWDQFLSSLKRIRKRKISSGASKTSTAEEETVVAPSCPYFLFFPRNKEKSLGFSGFSLGPVDRRDWDCGGGDLENIFEPCHDRGCIR